MNRLHRLFFLALLIFVIFAKVNASAVDASAAADVPVASVSFQDATPTPEPMTPAQLIALINRVRTGCGLPALIVDPILMGTAQSTADIMAAYAMAGHIGDVRGRVMAAGYGANDIPWATENFAVLPAGEDPSTVANAILSIWSDDLHMKPMADANYKHIGAGIAMAGEDAVYYIVHAAYTSNRIYKPNQTPAPGTPVAFSMSQYIFAVQTATPRADGKLVHVVRQGQSLWSIAIAYQTHIDILQRMNGMTSDNLTIYAGQKLYVPTAEKAAPIRVIAAETAAAVIGTATSTATLVPDAAINIDTPISATPTPSPAIPVTGDTLNQTILTVLIVLGLVGVASILFGVLIKR